MKPDGCAAPQEDTVQRDTQFKTPYSQVHLFGNFILAFKSQWMEEATASLIRAQGLRIQRWNSSGEKKILRKTQ